MSRIKRLAVFATGGGFALCLFAVILLQVHSVRMSGTHEFLHRTGMACMLGGLVVFLGANVAQRHHQRLQRTTRAVRGWSIFMPETLRTLQFVGGALMAVAIAGELMVAVAQGSPPQRSVLLVLFGVPGGLTWLIGAVGAAIATIVARPTLPPRFRRDEPVRATLVYDEWNEPEGAPVEVEAER
jgi:TRAP-type C4-dicarboxylate transport system permease small subunit